ncbi:MDR family oxidoreductase [Pseudoclavibacter sp. RFBA6]|uniref:MDR family oxidoreductase n=1 Tax=Pseudoclavibacter sp. RFBA6 TaxID=2080573 RepID=UPI000CE7A345|nr:MDR family oxidoreductase [Pseudoclavibacter sp. RFBA6]PPG38248.1 oxidoreductase [Pseudoclavibacter sp. RFBA6]
MVRGYLTTKSTDDAGKPRIDVAFDELDDELFGGGHLRRDQVLVDVAYTSLNYKDALLLAGKPGVSRADVLVPGIDVVGVVRESRTQNFVPGDRVVLNGAGLGETRHGGLAELCLVDDESLIHLPEAMSLVDGAAIGTAGYTAMLSVLALEKQVEPGDGDVLVTGAAGGVGSIAVALLASLGYRVVASTGRGDQEGDYLRRLGAAEIIDRHELSDAVGKPLQTERWAGAVDAVGSTTLANVIAQTRREGIVTSCGLAQGTDLPTTVMPFILRGVTLRGINSVVQSVEVRAEAWNRLLELDSELLESMTEVIGLEEALDYAHPILDGKVRGRTVVRVRGDL